MPRYSWAALGVILLAGCRAAGQQVIEGVNTRRDSLAEAVRPAVRAAVLEAGRAFEDSVRARLAKATGELGDSLEASVDTILRQVERRLDSIEISLGNYLAGGGRDAVGKLLAPNLELVRESVRDALKSWVVTLSRSVDSLLPDVTAGLAERAVGQAAASLAGSMGSNGPLRLALVALTDTVVRQAIFAISDQSKKQETPWWVWAGVVVVALLVISAVGGFILALWRAKRHRETSLRLVSKVIQEAGDPALAKRVKSLAIENGVEPELHQFLEEQRLLVPKEAP